MSFCEGCDLRGTSKKSKLYGNTYDPLILVVTNPPTKRMLFHKEVMSEGGQRIFNTLMGRAEFDLESDFAFFPYVRCMYDKDAFITSEKRNIEKHCREWLLDVINEIRPEVIIPLGADAAKLVEGRAVKITKARGLLKYNKEHGCYTFPMIDPHMVSNRIEHIPIFASDCNALARLIDYDYDVERAGQDVLGDYEEVDDLQFLIDMEPEVLAFDLETTNYDNPGPRWQDPDGDIVSMQFSTEPGKGWMVVLNHSKKKITGRKLNKIRRQTKQILTNPNTSVVGQNLKFDAMWILSRFKFRFRIDHDTLMMAALIDENSLSKDLDTLVKIYAPGMAGYADQFNDAFDKSRMDLVPLAKLLDYGCGDTDATLRVYIALRKLIEDDEQLWEHYRNVSIPGINAFVPVERRGLLIDEDALTDFEQELAKSVRKQYKNLVRQVPPSIRAEHLNDPKNAKKTGHKIISFGRHDFVRDILFNHPDGFRLTPCVFTKTTEKLAEDRRLPSTSSKDHLPYFFEECPFTEELANYIKDERLLGTNVRGFRKKYMLNGRIHPIYSLWTAVTGRSASRDPNGQNFPKRGPAAKAYRKIFVAPDGYAILEADLSQAELRISADMADEKVMIGIYKAGGDIHATTAASTMGIGLEVFMRGLDDETPLVDVAKYWPGSDVYLRGLSPNKRDTATVSGFCGFKRFQAKAINFGFIYGMGWRKFVRYAKTQYGVEFSDVEAQQIREAFFETYPALPGWHSRTRRFVQDNGYVRSYSGRVRHLPMVWSNDEAIASEAQRQAINSPVQEFASSLGIMSMGRIDAEVNPEFLQIIGFVHDAIYALVPLEYIEWGAKTLKYYMETNPLDEWFGRTLKLPIVADVGFGLNGGSTREMKGLRLDELYDFDKLGDLGFDLPDQEVPIDDGYIDTPEHLQIHW